MLLVWVGDAELELDSTDGETSADEVLFCSVELIDSCVTSSGDEDDDENETDIFLFFSFLCLWLWCLLRTISFVLGEELLVISVVDCEIDCGDWFKDDDFKDEIETKEILDGTAWDDENEFSEREAGFFDSVSSDNDSERETSLLILSGSCWKEDKSTLFFLCLCFFRCGDITYSFELEFVDNDTVSDSFDFELELSLSSRTRALILSARRFFETWVLESESSSKELCFQIFGSFYDFSYDVFWDFV